MNCPYCDGHLYPNRDGTFTCRCCDHNDIDIEEVKDASDCIRSE